MKIALGADSAGKPLLDVDRGASEVEARAQITNLSQSGFYADLSANLAHKVKDGDYDRGILFCGTGIGVCISANKVPGIRAALTHDTYSAERAAKSNNAQIITMGARVIGPELAKAIVDTWLASEFDPRARRPPMSRRSTSWMGPAEYAGPAHGEGQVSWHHAGDRRDDALQRREPEDDAGRSR